MGDTLKEAIAKEEGQVHLLTKNAEDGGGAAGTKEQEVEEGKGR